MSKNTIPAISIVANGDGWRITYDRFARDFTAEVENGIDWQPIAFCRTQIEAQTKINQYRFEELSSNACAGFGCGDCAGDIDFSQDEPTVAAQLKAKGMREAHGERGAYTNVTEHGRIIQVWACEASEPVARQPLQFWSYAEAKGA